MSRTDNSLRNLKTAVLFKLAAIVVNFIARKIFVVVLTKEYLGLDGTFANILTMLSLAELGVGTAITYSMYKPLAEGDQKLILSLMTLYRKFYTVIGITVGVLGAALTPFLQYIIRDIPDIPHIHLIYLMFVLDSSISYFLVYKQSLISADQKQHIVTAYQYKTGMAVTAAQCAALLLTGDYILYLALKLCATFVCNALLARKADRLYPYLKQKTVQPLPAPVRQDISKNIRAMIAHKLGSVVVFGTDNVLIAYFVGAVSVGLYSNYLLITQSLKSAYSMIFRAMTASIGNLCAAEDTAHAQAVFWRVDLLTRWIYGFSAVCLVVLFNPFISLWLGADYLFSMPIVLLIVFSFNSGNSNMVWKGFSLHWYTKLFRNRIIMQSVYTTLMVSLLATIIATVAGTFAAIGFYAMRRRVRNPLMTVNNIPMMNADIVTGVSMCLLFVAFFSGWGSFASWFNTLGLFRLPTHLTMGFGTLLIAHITFNIPYVILSVGPKLRQMDRNLVDAAMDLGCTWMQAFWKVIIPEIKPGIVSGALTAFTMSIDDFVISYFTAGSSSSTLAMTIYGMTKKKVTPEINAISTLLFVTVLVLLAVINVREARQERKLAAEQRR